MPIHGYAGGVISATPVVPTSTSASGIWTTELQAQALAAGNWPNASSQIARSLRFNSADTAYLSRTPASAGNRRTWTWSGWVKRSSLSGSRQGIFVCAPTGTDYWGMEFDASEKINIYDKNSTGGKDLTTTSVYRDVSAWYHIVIAVDTTQATASNRVKLYVNGTQVTSFSPANYPTQDSDTNVNSTSIHSIGSWNPAAGLYFDGYLSDVYLIDGQALTPSSFGFTDSNTGVWVPNAYTGSYGTNGFHLNFYNNTGTTSTTLGLDTSGNGNNWTPNNFSVTAGAGNDSLVDTPTPYGTDTGVGGEVRGNYCTVNPLDKSSDVTLSNGNLDASCAAGSAWRAARSTVGISSGKWYWEVLCNNISGSTDRALLGIMKSGANLSSYVGSDASGWGYYSNDGNKYSNATAAAYGASYSTGDVIGIAFDADNGDLKFYKNGTVQNSGTAAYTGLTSGPYIPAISLWNGSVTVNFGQRPFAYTAPSGFKALCTTNLPTPAIGATSTTQAGDYFNTVIWTGDGNNPRTVSGVGFQPDFVWAKLRSGAADHTLYDAVRGTGKVLFSNLTNAEGTNDAYGYLSAFNSDGFVASAGSTNNAYFNTLNSTYVAWNWKANGAGSSNTQGTITSTVSANTTSGFSVVTSNGTGNATIGHGLGVAPEMIIVKLRSQTSQWYVYHKSLGAGQYIQLNLTSGFVSDTAIWQNTAPTSTVFSIGSGINANLVAYCFAPVAGYSAFGSYTGNGDNDGPFVYTGFRPAYLLIKRSSLAGADWNIIDNRRNTYNPVINELAPNTSAAEDQYLDNRDFLSNGFKVRSNQGAVNTNGETYIYAAFAEYPFKYANAR